MDSTALLSLLHFADSGFPAGGYAHSLGLEAYCQAGLVTDAAGVEAFLLAHLEGAAGPADATAVAAAHRAMAAGDVDACRGLDDALEAMKAAPELREASRQMGRQTLRLAARLTGAPALGDYLAQVDDGRAPGHHAVAFGMAGGTAGWDVTAGVAGFLYSTAALLVGGALRLLPMGQTEGQRVLWRLHGAIARVAHEASTREPAAMWSFAPGIDVASMRHARLDARIFRS
jgi:urease accessory protein